MVFGLLDNLGKNNKVNKDNLNETLLENDLLEDDPEKQQIEDTSEDVRMKSLPKDDVSRKEDLGKEQENMNKIEDNLKENISDDYKLERDPEMQQNAPQVSSNDRDNNGNASRRKLLEMKRRKTEQRRLVEAQAKDIPNFVRQYWRQLTFMTTFLILIITVKIM